MPGFADDPGVGWHVKTGEYIARLGMLPSQDPFLFSMTPRSWITDQWLSDVLLYLGLNAGGWPLVYVSGVFLYLLTYFGVLYGGLVRLTGAGIFACLITLLAFKLGQVHFILRPVLPSFLLFSLVYVRVSALDVARREGRGGVPLIWDYLWLPALFALWTNVHPTFVIGLGFLGLLPVAWFLEGWMQGTLRQDLRALVTVCLLVLLCCLATLCNPHGVALHETILWLSRSEFAMGFYAEWQSPNFKSIEGLTFLMPLALLFMGGLLSESRDRCWTIFQALSVACFFYFGCKAVRMLPFWGIVVSLPCLERLQEACRASWWWKRWGVRLVAQVFAGLELRETRGSRGLLAGALLAIAMLVALFQGKVLFYDGHYGPSGERYPYAMLQPLAEAGRSGQVVVANHMAWGSFLNLFLDESVKPVIDDRTRLLGDDFYEAYFSNLRVGGNWQDYLRTLGATHVLLPATAPLSVVMKRYCKLPVVKEDELAILFDISGSNGPLCAR